MNRLPTNIQLWLPLGLLAFLGGMVTFGLVSGEMTGRAEAEINARMEQSFQSGFEQGYARGVAESPSISSEQATLNIISGQTFLNRLEIELKAIARATNAIDFTYGEVGLERHRESSLAVGEALAYQAGNLLYVIQNESVSANLQRATISVTRITIPQG
ncbi:MAG: hypothetical protein RLZZ385_1391 [Pseudomonadota bacterium]|jgi:hypothetical protein